MKPPPLHLMWPNYPNGNAFEVADLVGGTVGDNIRKGWETCCIRLSRALNLAGQPVEGFAGIAVSGMDDRDAKVRAKKGGDNKWYIYSCYDMLAYLNTRYGRAREFGSFEGSDLSGVRGIIMFARRHVDLWNGAEVRYNTDFTDGAKKVQQIFVWESPVAAVPGTRPSDHACTRR